MYFNNNDFNNENDVNQEQYEKTQKILGIILAIVVGLLIFLIVGKKLNIIDKADRIKPYLTNVTIKSNNAIDIYSAEIGNDIILTMEFNEKLKERPTVVINNKSLGAVKETDTRYVATYHVEEQYYTDKKVEFKIENYKDLSKNIGIPVFLTTDNSKVTIVAEHSIIHPVEIETIKIEAKKKVLNPNESLKLKAIIKPTNTTNKSVTWTTSNPEIAIVENGMVHGVSEGTVIITATSGEKEASIELIIKNKQIK